MDVDNLELGMSSGTAEGDGIARRRAAMAVLARAPAQAIADRLATLSPPDFERLRPGEPGLVMVRGRIGGDGAPFNLGEATVARAAVRLPGGPTGFGYVLGRDTAKAELIALVDAMLQTDQAAAVEQALIAPLRDAVAAATQRRAAETAATRVDFFTMVRGEG
jgi:alpha-D-ribose 1-methylphosphonate 5-triphosphate synthase subunit PhnG